MSEHVVTAEFEGDFRPYTRMTCHAPAESMCHAVYDCLCEEWHEAGLTEDGLPAHVAYDPDVDEVRHVGRFDPEFCNFREWFENSEEVLHGIVTFSVTPEWEGSGYLFHVATSEADR